MSTEGTGVVVGVAALTVGGIVLAAGAAAVGAGVLIGRGIMWCGEKLEENYQSACHEWTNLTEAARRENFANVEEVSAHLSLQLDRMATSDYLSVNSTPSHAEPEEIAAAIARTRNALQNPEAMTRDRTNIERTQLANALQAEINAGHGILPQEKLAQAQSAMNASVEDMRTALDALQAAWSDIHEVQAIRTRQIYQTQQIIQTVTIRLQGLETIQGSTKKAPHPVYIQQQDTIETLLRDAQTYLDVNPATALAKANEAQQVLQLLTNAIATDEITRASAMRKEITTLRGVLDTLAKMMNEATAIKLLDPQKATSLTERIHKAQQDAQALGQGQGPNSALLRLKDRVAMLKEDVFGVVKTGQQHNIAQMIAVTLAELGFQASQGGQPVLKTNGATMRVEAMVSRGTSTEPDEKVVSFDISPDGRINYDFSGYVGDACVHEAKRVFDALREKGIFIVDDQAADELLHTPAASITTDTLQQARFHPRITKNKSQAELAESLRRVLQKMDYPQVRQSSVGGAIELEAFKGSLGYRVVISSDGTTQVLKDASHTDVSSKASDPVASEAERAIRQEKQKKEQEKAKSPAKRLPKRQLLQNEGGF